MSSAKRFALCSLFAVTSPGCTVAECPTWADCSEAAAKRAQNQGTVPAETLPIGKWTDVTGNLADSVADDTNPCGRFAFLARRPSDGALVAGVDKTGLWLSKDDGVWEHLDGSENMSGRPSSIVFDPANPDGAWISTIYDTDGAAYETTDGATFSSLGNVHHVEALSVDLKDPERKTVIAGGHEQARHVFRRNQKVADWDSIGDALPEEAKNSSYPLVIDPATYLIGCSGWGGTVSGIYRTTDGGTSWALAVDAGGTGPPIIASTGAIYWSSDEEDGLVKSVDGGENWTKIVDKRGTLASVPPVELPDGRLLSLSSAYSPQHAVMSADDGATWKAVSSNVPFHAYGIAYDENRKAIFAWHSQCDGGTAPVAVIRYDFDYEAP